MHGNWQAYEVVLRLRTPLHVGWGRAAYLQRARPYVTARVLRGALVARLVRLQSQPEYALDDSATYRKIGKTVYQHLAFTYFFPALEHAGGWRLCLPWQEEGALQRRLLSSYAAAALQYPQQTAAEGLLYETEFISPYALDDGAPVFLFGYVFARQDSRLAWDVALRSGLQLGGERGYGWGRASLRSISEPLTPAADGTLTLFGQEVGFVAAEPHPLLRLPQGARVFAHTAVEGASLSGVIEPLVGREWRSEENRKHIGQYLNFDGLCIAPGGIVQSETVFKIGKGGRWHSID